jgi:hypothetical protein
LTPWKTNSDRSESSAFRHNLNKPKTSLSKRVLSKPIFSETLAALLKALGLAREEEAPQAISVPAHMRKPRKSHALDASLLRV